MLKFVDLVVSGGTVEEHLEMPAKDLFEKYVALNLQQLNEKIDRIRETAGRCLQKFFKFTYPKSNGVEFAERDSLAAFFLSGGDPESPCEEDDIEYLPWRSADFIFQNMKPFFDSEAYSVSILLGIV